MTADRGLSTVLDVAVCVLLVGAGVVALTAAVPDESVPATTDPTATARAVLDSTATVTVANETVRGTLATLLVDAAVADGHARAPDYADAVSVVATRRLANTTRTAAVTASWQPDAPCRAAVLAVGPTPPVGAAVDAVTLTVPTTNATGCGRASVHLTVRTWSP
ncbi:DUF7284 family protein [Halarchaeum sp. P4]|uniref:DUF7284 family protein n=1 Tax=Halarchaeum sp. P4 TaxID=3421639 RepID=UPI003EBFFE3E